MLRKSKINLSIVLMLGLIGLFITTLSFGTNAAVSDPPADAIVIIQNFSFQPATLTIKAGTKVTWINRDDDPHTATDTEKRFGSKALDTGDRFSTEFTKPGTYNYYCALHPKMTGQIIVK